MPRPELDSEYMCKNRLLEIGGYSDVNDVRIPVRVVGLYTRALRHLVWLANDPEITRVAEERSCSEAFALARERGLLNWLWSEHAATLYKAHLIRRGLK